jgi:hypothetical protein
MGLARTTKRHLARGEVLELAKRESRLAGRGSTVKLFPIGDVHLGAPACDVQSLRDTVAAVAKDPDAFWIGMGDYADYIFPGDPRWRLRTIDLNSIGRDSRGNLDVSDLAEWSMGLIEKEFGPILTPEKCLGLLEGNHERSFADHYFTDPTKRLCKKFGLSYLGQTAFIRWIFHRSSNGAVQFDIFAEHGATGGGTDGNSVNNLTKRLEQWDADILLKGHVHRRMVWRKTRLGWGPKAMTTRRQVLALTGCYLKGYDEGTLAYSEQKAYAPNELGGTVILLKPFEGKVDAIYTDALGMIA